MRSSSQPGLSLSCIVLASIVGLGMSCGSARRAPEAPIAELPTAAPASIELSMKVASVALGEELKIATMSLIDVDVSDDIRSYLGFETTEVGEEHPIAVTFRLGPKMASRTFDIGLDGEVEAADLKKIRHMFRCRRSGRTRRMHRGLFAKIADLSNYYEGHTIEVISAYRHGKNAKPSSRHRHGRAIDIRVVGIPAAQVRDYLWARYEEEVGVGFYKQQQFVHLDHRTNYKATAWTQKHHSAENDYKPRWARSARRSKLVVALAGTDAP